MTVEYDRATKAWFDSHIGQQTTVCRCDKCNFKAELGICRIKEFVVDKLGDMPVGFGSMGSY